jgi:RNA ligase
MFDPKLKTTHNTLFHPDPFLNIKHRDDILPLVADNKAIRFFTNGPIQVLKYMINGPDVFTTSADLECRGLVFDTQTGLILSRPLHKFFNVDERATAQELIAQGPGRLINKLDGSMIATYRQSDELYFHTKGGLTRQALFIRKEAPTNILQLSNEAFKLGYTPSYEWTSPDNRVVVNYTTSHMTLLALRHIETGVYDEDLADALAQKYGVARPKVHFTITTETEFLDAIKALRDWTGIEGAVWLGPNGMRAKVKTKEYMKIHKTLSMLNIERHALRAVIEDLDDDIVPLLSPEQRTAWETYARDMRTRFLEIEQEAHTTLLPLVDKDAKTAAAYIQANVAPALRPIVFALRQNRSGLETLLKILGTNVGTDARVQNTKQDYTLPDWGPYASLFEND